MKKSGSSFLPPLAVILLLLISAGARAQDDGLTSYDLQNTTSEVIEHENKTARNLIATRDSLQISDFYQKPKVADKRTASTSESNEEDDALSLNFLFYIIENYKFSDLMDK